MCIKKTSKTSFVINKMINSLLIKSSEEYYKNLIFMM